MPVDTARTIPDDLTEMSDEELDSLLADLEAEFDRRHEEGSKDIAEMTSLADDIVAVRGEQKRREDEEAEVEAALDALVEKVHPASETDTGDEDDDDDDDDDQKPAPEPPPTNDAAEPSKETAIVPDEVITASGTRSRPSLARTRERAPRPRVEQRPETTLTLIAAADLPGISPGATIDLSQVATSFHDKARTLNDRGPRVPVARIEGIHPPERTLGNNPGENARMLREVVGTPNAVSLVASGGWCAPSEPIFALFDLAPDTSMLFDVPSLGAPVRAGVLVPTFYGIGDVVEDGSGFWNWTEADDIAAVPPNTTEKLKTCLRLPCPTWTECRLEAEGLCVTHGNLADRAWPELTAYWLGLVTAAHMYRISAAKMAKVLGTLTAVAPHADMLKSDIAGDLLNVIALQAADMRSFYRLPRTRAIDVLMPEWILEVLKANMAMRAGVDFMSVTDAQVTGWLAAKGIRPLFSPYYQPISTSSTPATNWPATVEIGMWLSGAYVSLDGGTIDLGVQRDSILNETNDFTLAWTEQFFQVCRIGPAGRKVTLPVNVDGVTACCAAA